MGKIKQAVKHTGKARKEQIVAELVEKLDNSNGLVFVDYQGLTHIQLEGLKNEVKKLDSTIIVTKNSLIRISLGKSQKYAEFKDDKNLDRPTAALFIQADYAEPLKKLAKAIKAFGLPKIKLGILEGQVLDEAGVLKIALLPNRETLLTQLVGTLNSPIQGLVIALNANLQKFVMTLNAIARLPRPEPSDGGQAQAKPSATNNQQSEIVEPATPAEPASEPTTTEPDQSTTQADQATPETESKNETEDKQA